ncbi:hypothetical protein KY290_001084 [Solanum tuberosum]|uniref:Replication factor A C-terminal domain-containing protein n=1 Tax=Solanum tuberosum TaxID=4113 RepID=A0ABQ7WMH1_SOLTU|nr:hypothetical protein KY290_001084 [Solanum tuberosum]
MAYSLLSDLDSTREDWLGRRGTLMHAAIWKNQVSKFRDKLSEGYAIIIRNFKDDIVYIPVNGFQFIQPEMIRSRVNNNIVLSDMVGCVCGIGDLESVGSKWKKRNIHILTDPEDRTIKARITLWEDHGEVFYPYVYPNQFGPYIVIVTATTLKEFRAASKIYANLKMDNITSLLHKFSKKSVDVQTIGSANASNVPIAEAMFENRMTIAELVGYDWSSDIEECVITLRAQITEIDNFFDWYYISCNFCNKKVESSNGVYTCQKCNKQCDLPLVRFKIHIKVKDNGGQTTLVLFNGVAEKLLDTSAHKLVN